MRAEKGTAMTLDAGYRVPHGNFIGNVAFFVLRGAHGPRAVVRHFANGNRLAFLFHHLGGNLFHKVGSVSRHRFDGFYFCGHFIGIIDLLDAAYCLINGGDIHGDDFFAFFAV